MRMLQVRWRAVHAIRVMHGQALVLSTAGPLRVRAGDRTLQPHRPPPPSPLARVQPRSAAHD